jgi:hypothetical protein
MGKIFLTFRKKASKQNNLSNRKENVFSLVSNRKRRIKNVCVCVKYYEGEPYSTKMLVDKLAEKTLITYG